MIKDKIGNLFHIVYGQKEYHNKEWLEGDGGGGVLISSKGVDNGVYGFFDIENKFEAPVITVQGYGTIGEAFVQEYDCSVDDHLLILKAKSELTVYQLYQVAYQIRLIKWKYKYGRGITPSRLKNEEVTIEDFDTDWKSFESELTPVEAPKKYIVENKDIKWIQLKDLCKIERYYYLYLFEVNTNEELTPYITTTEKNNGVGLFCGEDAISDAKKVTISLDGKCGDAFYQIFKFVAGEKTAVIDCEDKFLLIYIGACVKFLSWKFHYGRKLSMARLEEMAVPLPQKDGKVDLDYIQTVVKNSYGYGYIENDL